VSPPHQISVPISSTKNLFWGHKPFPTHWLWVLVPALGEQQQEGTCAVGTSCLRVLGDVLLMVGEAAGEERVATRPSHACLSSFGSGGRLRARELV